MGRTMKALELQNLDLISELGAGIRKTRKALGLTMQELAEASGISRVTLHKVEKGDPSVSAGALASVALALGVPLKLDVPLVAETEQIVVGDYRGLSSLTWQLNPTTTLSGYEAWSIYSKNWRHLDLSLVDANEGALIQQLSRMFGALGVS